MKSKIVKFLLALGCAATIGAVSTQAQAGYRCPGYKCPKVYVYKCDGYKRMYGCGSTCCGVNYQGRPLMRVGCDLYYVQKCSGYYKWSHHKHRYVCRACCS